MPKPEPTSADIARGYGIDLNAPGESGISRMQREAVARSDAETTARAAAGLGFWRLVWIVALGILLAQAIAAAAVAILRALTAS